MVVCKVDELARTPQRLRNAGVCQPDCLTLQRLRDKVLDVEFEDSSSKPRMSETWARSFRIDALV
jgi:hypothetical protein